MKTLIKGGRVLDPASKTDAVKDVLFEDGVILKVAENITDETTVEGQIFTRLSKLEQIRKQERVFVSNADTWTIETWDSSVLCIGRYFEGEKMIGLFNFSEYDKTAWINETDGEYVDLISGRKMQASGVDIPAYGFYYLKKING